MYMKRLESILKEEWLKSDSWYCLNKDDQKRFHMALQRAYKELEYPPSNQDFVFVLNNLIDDPSKNTSIQNFAKKAELMFNYYRIVG